MVAFLLECVDPALSYSCAESTSLLISFAILHACFCNGIHLVVPTQSLIVLRCCGFLQVCLTGAQRGVWVIGVSGDQFVTTFHNGAVAGANRVSFGL